MSFNTSEFEIALIKRHKTKTDIANALGINIATLYRKINGSSDFFRLEINKICTFLNLSEEERGKIFFG